MHLFLGQPRTLQTGPEGDPAKGHAEVQSDGQNRLLILVALPNQKIRLQSHGVKQGADGEKDRNKGLQCSDGPEGDGSTRFRSSKCVSVCMWNAGPTRSTGPLRLLHRGDGEYAFHATGYELDVFGAFCILGPNAAEEYAMMTSERRIDGSSSELKLKAPISRPGTSKVLGFGCLQ